MDSEMLQCTSSIREFIWATLTATLTHLGNLIYYPACTRCTNIVRVTLASECSG